MVEEGEDLRSTFESILGSGSDRQAPAHDRRAAALHSPVAQRETLQRIRSKMWSKPAWTVLAVALLVIIFVCVCMRRRGASDRLMPIDAPKTLETDDTDPLFQPFD